MSEDPEGIVMVVDGRQQVEAELAESASELRHHVEAGIASLLEERHFREALPGYLSAEDDLDRRMRELHRRLRAMVVGRREWLPRMGRGTAASHQHLRNRGRGGGRCAHPGMSGSARRRIPAAPLSAPVGTAWWPGQALVARVASVQR